MITILPPDNQYIPEIGDVLWGAAADWAAPEPPYEADPMRIAGLMLNKLDGDEKDYKGIFPLGYAYPNPITALKCFDIDHKWFLQATHKDPYLQWTVYGIIPVAVLTRNPESYRESVTKSHIPFPDLIMDMEWVKEMQGDQILEIHRISSLLLGSGYNQGCSVNDGHCSQEFAKLKLSNDDWLYVAFWEWYNK